MLNAMDALAAASYDHIWKVRNKTTHDFAKSKTIYNVPYAYGWKSETYKKTQRHKTARRDTPQETQAGSIPSLVFKSPLRFLHRGSAAGPYPKGMAAVGACPK